MEPSVDSSGNPIPTSAVLMATSKHIAKRCKEENMAFLNCKKKDPNPEKCLDKGRQVTYCILNLYGCYRYISTPGLVNCIQVFCMCGGGDSGGWARNIHELDNNTLVERREKGGSAHKRSLKDLHQKCPKEMETYAGCMYYHTNEFELCRKEQAEFEKACPFNE